MLQTPEPPPESASDVEPEALAQDAADSGPESLGEDGGDARATPDAGADQGDVGGDEQA